MDIAKTIQYLREEKAKLDAVVAALEQLQRESGSRRVPSLGGKRRGRTSMDARERQEVSARMKRYWAKRRQQKSSGKKDDDTGHSE